MVSKIVRLFIVIFLLNGFSFCQSPNRKKSPDGTLKARDKGQILAKSEAGKVANTSKRTNKMDSIPQYGQLNSDVGPDDIRVLATVKFIRPLSKTESPCDRYACLAEILIDDIVQRGRTYAGGIEVGQKIVGFFPMTLEVTSKVFLQQDVRHYPGLKEGDRFQADISGGELLDDVAASSPTILTYELMH
jgi:hypothetical protein